MITITLPAESFDVVVIDPPWPFKTRTEKGAEKSPEAKYKTMSFAVIEALNAADLLAPGGVLFLWATWPLLPQQMRVLRAWGISYVSGGAWAKRTRTGKLRWGPGFVQRSVCEPYLIGKLQGSPFCGRGFANLIETFSEESIDGLAREHSRKPDEFYARIEAAWPGARRADVFARAERKGWTCWGDQAGCFT